MNAILLGPPSRAYCNKSTNTMHLGLLMATAIATSLIAFNCAPSLLAQETFEMDAFNAIRTLHAKLDVDGDGEVEDFESKHFLESERISNRNGNANNNDKNAHKLRYLHQDGKDTAISLNELWQAWKSSQVHNWTAEETIYWLINYVELPQYSLLFEQNSINGTVLPRLAADSQFMGKLGITDLAAKKKISIKAMDVVLFGPPKIGNSNTIRDIIVSLIVVVAIAACIVFYNRSKLAQKALREMQENLESLQKAEDQLQGVQQELKKAVEERKVVSTEKKNLEHQLEMQRQFSASSNLSEQSRVLSSQQATGSNQPITDGDIHMHDSVHVAKLEEEVKNLRKELEETSNSVAKKFRAPFHLRSLLRTTYNMESQYYNEKKLNLESKATEVKLRNQKLQKKKSSFLGYYKMAQENSLEEDLNNIVEVKEAIMQVTKEIKERSERWRAIEELCGCSLELTQPTLRL